MKIHDIENNNENFSVVIIEGQATVVDAGNTDFIVGDKLSEFMIMTYFKYIKSREVADGSVNITESICDSCKYMLCA